MIGKKFSDKAVSDLLADLADQERYVYLDTSLPDHDNGQSLLFTRPLKQLKYRPGDDRALFFDQLLHYLDQGYYLAGWFGYEFFHDQLSIGCKDSACITASLGVYKQPKIIDHDNVNADLIPVDQRRRNAQTYQLTNLLPNMEENRYCQAIKTILEYIAAGDTYQVNYTFKFSFDFEGSATDFYTDLRRSQPVPYGSCIKDKDHYILSFSPELFFRADQKRIFAKPMKGTMKRGRTVEEDSGYMQRLHNDEKNRSENVMIVDLLRNDLSRLVEATGGGFVNVTSLFDVERYQSVFQMTSSIVADRLLESRVSPEQMLRALFPCGSVTGAPKIRTMEIIDELEEQPRGVYTGAIGYFSPAGKAVFNVPIRTVVLNGSKGEMGIGSGIVADSSPEDEWQECLLKARFLTNPLPEFELIETMLYNRQHGFLFLDDHLLRLQHTASYFDFPYDKEQIVEHLEQLALSFEPDVCRRVRLTLSAEGTVDLTTADCDPPAHLRLPGSQDDADLQPVTIEFAEQTTDSSWPWFFHKTTRRKLYDEAYRQAKAAGLFDVIFCNERGEVTEGCITNIFVLKRGHYYTPPLNSGLLDGIMRKRLLEGAAGMPVHEKVLFKTDLMEADKIYLSNSVRGVIAARIRPDR